jgi:two-component system, NtrC family, response regulator AtoC
VVPIRIPNLRDRREDIPLLVRHFVQAASKQLGTSVSAIAPETMDLLQAFSWPGNVRQLANHVERAVILSRGEVLLPGLFGELRHQPDGVDGNEAGESPPRGGPDRGLQLPPGLFNLARVERLTIEAALEATRGNKRKAADLLGISDRTIRNKLGSGSGADQEGA